MVQNIFLVILFCEALCACMLCLSILVSRKRVWSPPSVDSWQFYMMWTAIIVSFFGTIWLAFLDWNNFIFGHWSRFLVGGFLMSAGYAIYYWARQHLGWKMMMGLKGKSIATGIYKYTRNPMYIGDVALCVGFALICNSLLIYVVAIIGFILFLFTPLAEEPWLREQYGTQYDNYVSSVARFIPPLRNWTEKKA